MNIQHRTKDWTIIIEKEKIMNIKLVKKGHE